MERTANHVEKLDVLIVGPGISGLGAAYYRNVSTPAVLRDPRARDPWAEPGICSATRGSGRTDLHTFGYEFKPWRDGDAIASRRQDHGLPARDRGREPYRRQDPIPAQGARCGLVQCRARWTVDVENLETQELISSVPTGSSWRAATTVTTRATPRFPGQ